MPAQEEGVFVALSFSEDTPIGALDLSAFLFDLNRLYVVAFKAEQDPYEIDEASFRGYGRGSFRIPKQHQLNISRIRFQSPGLVILSTAFAGIAAVWTVIQIIEKVKFWPLQKEKLRLEIAKLRTEVVGRGSAELGAPILIRPGKSEKATLLRRRRPRDERQRIEPILALPIAQSAIKQLSANPLRPTGLTIDIVERKSHLY